MSQVEPCNGREDTRSSGLNETMEEEEEGYNRSDEVKE